MRKIFHCIKSERKGSLYFKIGLVSILTFLIFFAYPIVNTVMMSFQKVAGENTTFIGLENYKTLSNPVFIKCLSESPSKNRLDIGANKASSLNDNKPAFAV